jgi:hypothetical protein
MTDSVIMGLIDNANLTFKVSDPTSPMSINPDTGNPIVAENTIVIRAKLKQNDRPPRDAVRNQTNNRPSIYMDGKCCSPAQMPAGIAKDAIADCEIDGFGKGRFYLYPVVPSAALVRLELQDITGQKIAGWFEAEVI